MPFIHRLDVRFRDLDALGHVNHAVFVTYLEVARTAWWRAFLAGRPFEEEGFLIAHVTLDYRAPVSLEDRVEVQLRVVRVGRTSFTLGYHLHREADGVLLAEGETVQVMLDFATGRPRPISGQTTAWLRSQA